MFTSITPQHMIDDVEAQTDNDGYDMVSDAQFVEWMNDEIGTMWQWATRANRDAFTKSVEGQIATGNYISITAAAPTGLGVTDFLNARGLDIKFASDDYRRVRPYNFVTRDRVAEISYRILGEQLWINPPTYATTYPFRLWYIHSAPVASSSALSTPLSLPYQGEDYVKQGMAAKMRIRLDDDPRPHEEAQEIAKRNIIAWLQASKGDQQVIADVESDFCEEW